MKLTGPPARWVVQGGRPADAVWQGRNPGPGLPSYESETGALLVFDLLLAQRDSDGEVRFFPRFYGSVCALAPEGLTCLYHDPDAVWSWRPIIYRLAWESEILRYGSQQELGWRKCLAEVMAHIHAEGELTMDAASDRASKLLLQHLTPQQRLELQVKRRFPVRGGATRNLYEVELGNGFQLVDKTTRELCVSYCFHPDHWLPDADVALGTKLMLEDEQLEPEVLENARSIIYNHRRRATRGDRYAAAIERELVA